MSTVNLNLDDYLVEILGELHQPIGEAAIELIVLKLYRMGKLSSGRGATALGMSRLDFIQHASDLGIAYLRKLVSPVSWSRKAFAWRSAARS